MRKVQLAIIAAVLVMAAQARAGITIDYTVGGVAAIDFGGNSPTDPYHDTVTILPYSSSGLSLPDNTPVTAMINTMNLVIYYTNVQGQFTVPANRSMSITVPSGGTQTLTQNLLLDSWFQNNPNDTVWTLPPGGTATFTLAGIGTVDVTPLAEGPFIHYNGEYNHVLSASFLFTPNAAPLVGEVPEPTSIIAWSLLGLTFGGAGCWRRRKLST